MEGMQVIRRKFVVDETPYCSLEAEGPGAVLEYLHNLDPEYFLYLVGVHKAKLETADNLRAAIAIRTTYAQALETFFALLFSALQAPTSIRGWLVSYSIKDLRNLIQKVNAKQVVLTVFKKDSPISWEDISNIIFSRSQITDAEKVKQFFATLWRFFAADFINEEMEREYNSIKHGLRIIPGGFSSEFTLLNEQGEAKEDGKWTFIGASEYGSSFPVLEALRKKGQGKDRVNFILRQHAMNWSPEYFCAAIGWLSLSIRNLIEFLKITNNESNSEIGYLVPGGKDTDNIMKDLGRLKFSVGALSFRVDFFDGDNPALRGCSKEEILQLYKKSSQSPENENKSAVQ